MLEDKHNVVRLNGIGTAAELHMTVRVVIRVEGIRESEGLNNSTRLNHNRYGTFCRKYSHQMRIGWEFQAERIRRVAMMALLDGTIGSDCFVIARVDKDLVSKAKEKPFIARRKH